MEAISLKADTMRLFAGAIRDVRISKKTDGALVTVSQAINGRFLTDRSGVRSHPFGSCTVR